MWNRRELKRRAFLLDLSFLGRDFLVMLTLGILKLFHVSPYKRAADAALYLALKNGQSTAEIFE